MCTQVKFYCNNTVCRYFLSYGNLKHIICNLKLNFKTCFLINLQYKLNDGSRRRFIRSEATFQTSDQTSPTKRNIKKHFLSTFAQQISGKNSRVNKTEMQKFLKNLSFEVDLKTYVPTLMYKINMVRKSRS